MSEPLRPTALITGADRGIGLALARRLGAEGANLVLHSHDAESLRATVEREKWPEERLHTSVLDVSDAAAVERAVAEAMDRFGAIDHLLNVAGIVHFGGIEKCTVDEWERTLRTNLTGYFLMARTVLPHMRAAGSGVIVNMSSIWGRRPAPGTLAYSVSKYGVEGLTKCLAEEARPWGVKVSSLVLDKVDTGFRDGMAEYVSYDEEQRDRMLSADDVADATWAVLSSSSRAHPSSIELDAWRWV
ncbi:SDR family NAD(P)-dependent oxidoreductase [Streptomyces termitum]|uniref:3-ketoacyl-ACP reductase n=1 Tax=Streptomyces termitum TaxID=67368 RepID=A0A918WDH5_9ACTN|nr:SDR family oxidoreductase [Streptomyces termitum]GHB06713.1 3-ketoacyl-ACP reductase [Streptomyces termitum]